MISCREKEMLMVMRFMADHTRDFADELSAIQREIEANALTEHTIQHLPRVSEYSDIIQVAKDAGYDLNIRIEDLLTPEELAELDARYQEIEEEFAAKTRLGKTDLAFLLVAVALQMLRQFFQPSLDFDAFSPPKERKGNKETAKDAKDTINDKKVDKQKKQAEGDKTKGSRYYHASLEQISNFGYTPYDLTESGKYKLKIGGTNHRYKTLGHDPWLGYFFGTFNILTDTVTLSKENGFRSFHVGRSNIGHIIPVAKADFEKIVRHGCTRWEESKATVGLAVAHQAYHINSDKLSHDGIPLPFLQLFFDSEFIRKLVNDGFDYAKLEFFGNVGKQLALAEVIDYIVAVAHRFTVVLKERAPGEKGREVSLEDFKKSLMKQKTLDEVRTRKIILISTGMASVANALIIGGTEAAALLTENPELAEKVLKKLDLGGYLSTICHLITDVRFITKVKKEFCANIIEEDFQRQLSALGVTS